MWRVRVRFVCVFGQHKHDRRIFKQFYLLIFVVATAHKSKKPTHLRDDYDYGDDTVRLSTELFGVRIEQ